MPHSGVEEFRRTARENMFHGVDVLKIFVTPGAPVPAAGDFVPASITYDEIKNGCRRGKGNGYPYRCTLYWREKALIIV